MKKAYLLVGMLLLPLSASANFSANLSYGSTNADVYQLQDVLQEVGCLNHASTGYFGLLTLHAVECYQDQNQLPVTGYVGSLTRAVLNEHLSTELATSTQAQLDETGTTTLPTFCPVGFTCTIINQMESTPTTTVETTPIQPVATSPAPALPDFRVAVSVQNSSVAFARIVTTVPIDTVLTTFTASDGTSPTLTFTEENMGTTNCYRPWNVCGVFQYRIDFAPSPIGNTSFAQASLHVATSDGRSKNIEIDGLNNQGAWQNPIYQD